jgi:hypothetical protein
MENLNEKITKLEKLVKEKQLEIDAILHYLRVLKNNKDSFNRFKEITNKEEVRRS